MKTIIFTKEVPGFKTTDGAKFDDKSEAVRRETKIILQECPPEKRIDDCTLSIESAKYITEDGMEFDKHYKAESHEKVLNFEKIKNGIRKQLEDGNFKMRLLRFLSVRDKKSITDLESRLEDYIDTFARRKSIDDYISCQYLVVEYLYNGRYDDYDEEYLFCDSVEEVEKITNDIQKDMQKHPGSCYFSIFDLWADDFDYLKPLSLSVKVIEK
ncbi:MAG: hypothetical protein UT24_C0011G0040 [Candidatus Woesebacteria bacterium GW2011_GWB1_39_12]|uniref:Uncharacterized protein n=1 Tax=Candidatus Woesebacteria bacterium GW2011_GWB1_39_12 TaxID=1618574 RepID=A0A0G0QFV9_9BACT|nr:MAG: hypothetical protein UT24_C0011G0040 [Candidatus Woesebacteria bacterium GW2011_GWB1_39_12]